MVVIFFGVAVRVAVRITGILIIAVGILKECWRY
jgi:hypothetical protein